MHEVQEKVRQFYKMLRSPISPAPPALREAELRARLILEEALETASGLVGRAAAAKVARDMMDGDKYATWSRSPDLVETVDGLCDLVYVVYGTAEAIGIDLGPYFDAVHEANMKKTPEPIDAHGKRGKKPPGWVDPKTKITEMLQGALAEHEVNFSRRYRRD